MTSSTAWTPCIRSPDSGCGRGLASCVRLTELDKSSKDTLAARRHGDGEYAPEFYDEILNLQGVQDLYTKIDGEVDGLGTILQDELAAVAGA